MLDESYATVALRAVESDQATAQAWAQLISREELRADTLAKMQMRLAVSGR